MTAAGNAETFGIYCEDERKYFNGFGWAPAARDCAFMLRKDADRKVKAWNDIQAKAKVPVKRYTLLPRAEVLVRMRTPATAK